MRILAKSNGSTAQIRLSPLKYRLFGTGEENSVKREAGKAAGKIILHNGRLQGTISSSRTISGPLNW